MTAATTATAEEFTISRTIDAPRDVVWKAWTDPVDLAKWWGPKGSTLRVLKLDFRPGGVFHYSMEYQPGKPMYGRFVYREIVAPEKIVFVVSFSDEAGGITRAPFEQLKDKWPLEVLNVLTLTEERGKTMLSLRGAPITANADELAVFTGMHDSMRQGFGGTFDQLDAHLANR